MIGDPRKGRVPIDRSSMSERFSAAMRGDDESFSDVGLRGGRGNLKTYAIEVNGVDDPEAAASMVMALSSELGLSGARTSDEAIVAVWSEEGSFLADVLTPRYWLLHTASSAAWAGKILRNAVGNSTAVDRCWFPWELLERLMRTGTRPKWFKSDFLGDELLPSYNVAARRLRMQFEGDAAGDVLDLLARSDERLRPAIALSQVATEVEAPLLGRNDELITNAGRFVARGMSFELHVGFVGQALRGYGDLVRRTEERYGFTWRSGDGGRGLTYQGEPVVINLPREIDDMERFVAGLFAAREPFRLWAVPSFTSERYVEAEVVDLHVGQRFRMDISPELMRLYLPGSACGNTVLRLVTNLQHRFSASVATEELAGSSF
jgi:hypothetical protein